jgi:hypothetical protein
MCMIKNKNDYNNNHDDDDSCVVDVNHDIE